MEFLQSLFSDPMTDMILKMVLEKYGLAREKRAQMAGQLKTTI